MLIHFYTYDVLIYFKNKIKGSLIIKVHVNVFCIHEWLHLWIVMCIYILHINLKINLKEILKYKST
jgi:hypothetical protein